MLEQDSGLQVRMANAEYQQSQHDSICTCTIITQLPHDPSPPPNPHPPFVSVPTANPDLTALCCCLQLAPATGGFVLGQLVGSLYEREASRQGSGKTCNGSSCFRYATCAYVCFFSLYANIVYLLCTV